MYKLQKNTSAYKVIKEGLATIFYEAATENAELFLSDPPTFIRFDTKVVPGWITNSSIW